MAPAPGADRRLAGIAATGLLHVALILGWQMARQAPPVPTEGPAIQWLRLAPPTQQATPVEAPQYGRARTAATAAARPRSNPTPAEHTARTEAPAAASEHGDVLTQPAAESAPPAVEASAASIVEQARRTAGDIDRALRKERQPTIVLPPDSPEIRMRRRMDEARALAPPHLWEAPKTEELVNNTGDGARRTRVITGHGSYCITERAPTTSIDMIEKHGRQRFTNCPQHEEPARRQEWRTARD